MGVRSLADGFGGKRPFADQIARGLSALVPAVLILILPIIPRIIFLEVGVASQPSTVLIETSTIVQQTQQELYAVNWLILFFSLIFSFALIGIFFAIAKVADKIKR